MPVVEFLITIMNKTCHQNYVNSFQFQIVNHSSILWQKSFTENVYWLVFH